MKIRLLVLAACGAVLSVISGCKTYRDVGPLLEAARVSFEQAKALELQAIDVDAGRQMADAALFEQLEGAAVFAMNILIISGWDEQSRDFRNPRVAWAGWFGKEQFDDIQAPELAAERDRVRRHLETQLKYLHDNNGQTEEKSVSLYELYVVKGGDLAKLSQHPNAASTGQLAADYSRLAGQIRTELFAQAPSVVAVRRAAIQHEQTIRAEQQRRIERTNATYESLLSMTDLARSQATTLTDNAGVISFVDRLVRTANNLLKSAQSPPAQTKLKEITP